MKTKPAPAKINFAKSFEWEIPDGTTLRVKGELKIGSPVMVIDQKTKKEIPVVDGTYVCDKAGEKWELITANGLISNVRKVDAPQAQGKAPSTITMKKKPKAATLTPIRVKKSAEQIQKEMDAWRKANKLA